jgi:hypothetical protein
VQGAEHGEVQGAEHGEVQGAEHGEVQGAEHGEPALGVSGATGSSDVGLTRPV